MGGVLPDPFKDLEAFAPGWALATGTERNRKRLSSSMEEIRSFYDAILPLKDEVIQCLSAYPLGDLPREAKTLLYLLLSLAEVAPAVEFFKQPRVVDGFEAERFVAVGEVPD